MQLNIRLIILSLTIGFGTGAVVVGAEPIPVEIPVRGKPVDFATEIAPILRAHCQACHHEKKASGGLNLESPQSIVQGGDQGPAILPGKGDTSLLLRVAAHQQESIMPPPENVVGAKSLSPAQLGLLKLWIDQGAMGTLVPARNIQWKSLPVGYQPAMATAVTPDGQFAVASRGNKLAVYHLPTGRHDGFLVDPGINGMASASSGGPALSEVAHMDLVRCLAFNSTGDLLASGGFREVKIWRRPRITRTGEWLHESSVVAMALSGDQIWCAVGDEAGRVHLRNVQTDQLSHSIAAHQGEVTCVEFTVDSKMMLTGGIDKSLRVWSVGTGQPIGKAIDHPTAIRAMALLNRGEWLMTACEDGTTRVWDLKAVCDPVREQIQPLKEMKTHEGPIVAVIAMPLMEQQFLTGGADGLVRRWDGSSGQRIAEFRHEGPLRNLAVSADARRIAAVGQMGLTLWDESGKVIIHRNLDPILQNHVEKNDAEIRFSKSAISLAQQDLNSYEGLIRIAKVRTEDIKKAEDELTKVQKSRDEKRAALDKAKAENAAKTEAEARAGKEKTEAAEKALADAETAVMVAMSVVDRAKAIAQRTDTELADAQKDVVVREERLKQQESGKSAAEAIAKARLPGFRSLAFSTDGRQLYVGSESGDMHHFDAPSGVWAGTRKEHAGPIHAIRCTSSERLLTGSADRRVLVWTAPKDWRLERVIGGPDRAELLVDRVLSLDFSPDGQTLVTGGGVPSRSGELKIWNIPNGELVRELKDAHRETIFAVRYSPDGKHIASAAGDRVIKVFNSESGEFIKRFAGHTGQVLTVSWKADSAMLVSGGADNVLKLWDLDRGVPLRTMKGTTYRIGSYKREITAVAFLGESEQILAASGDGTVRLHRTTSENDILTFSESKGYQFSVAATTDGRFVLAGASDGTVRVWSGHEQQPKHTFRATTD